jgi:hypothetical protein
MHIHLFKRRANRISTAYRDFRQDTPRADNAARKHRTAGLAGRARLA